MEDGEERGGPPAEDVVDGDLVSLLEEEGDHGGPQVAGPSRNQNGLYVLIIAGNNHVEKRMEKTSEMVSLRCENKIRFQRYPTVNEKLSALLTCLFNPIYYVLFVLLILDIFHSAKSSKDHELVQV